MRGRPAPLSPASSLLEKEELIQSVSALARLELKWRAFVHARQLTPTEGQAILTCILKARGKFPSPILSAFDKLGQTSLNTTDDALSFAQAVVQAAESQLAA